MRVEIGPDNELWISDKKGKEYEQAKEKEYQEAWERGEQAASWGE